MQQALTLGFAEEFIIHTPLMHIDKAETWRMAERLGGEALVALIVEETVTCYEGDRTQRHALGLRLRRLPGLHFAGLRISPLPR
jgi:7-cyano-7-deazaguanine synthase